jgi:hypothetical protein
MVRSFRKQVVDSRVLGRGRHQVVQDYHVSPTTPDSLRLRTDILRTGIKKEKDEEEEEDVEGEEEKDV